jgi:NADH:ubiquinone oxidoreductase subunit C
VDNQSFFKSLIATLPKWIHQFQKSKHENILYTNPDYLFQLLWFLKYHTNTRFQVLIDICGVDYPSRKQRFEVVYNLLRATAKSPNKVLIRTKRMRRCRSLQRNGHDLFGGYTQHPMENIACRERGSQGIANP